MFGKANISTLRLGRKDHQVHPRKDRIEKQGSVGEGQEEACQERASCASSRAGDSYQGGTEDYSGIRCGDGDTKHCEARGLTGSTNDRLVKSMPRLSPTMADPDSQDSYYDFNDP